MTYEIKSNEKITTKHSNIFIYCVSKKKFEYSFLYKII